MLKAMEPIPVVPETPATSKWPAADAMLLGGDVDVGKELNNMRTEFALVDKMMEMNDKLRTDIKELVAKKDGEVKEYEEKRKGWALEVNSLSTEIKVLKRRNEQLEQQVQKPTPHKEQTPTPSPHAGTHRGVHLLRSSRFRVPARQGLPLYRPRGIRDVASDYSQSCQLRCKHFSGAAVSLGGCSRLQA